MSYFIILKKEKKRTFSVVVSLDQLLIVDVSITTPRLLVALQIHSALEAVLTAGAAERPVAAMLSAVGDEVGALAERFAAHFAHMWFLT